MNRKKKILFLSVLLMTIGFAAVSTTLYLNGAVGIGTNNADFDVYFSKAVENGADNNTLIQDKTHLVFETELLNVDEVYTLEYEVTNGSKNYDANVTINCTGGNDYLRVENDFDITTPLAGRTTRNGTLKLTVIKAPLEEQRVEVACEIKGSAVERTELAIGEKRLKQNIIEYEKEYLGGGNWNTTAVTFLGQRFENGIQNIAKVTFLNHIDIPENAQKVWDASEGANESVMAWTTLNENNMEEVYIGQEGGVIANPNSSELFKELRGLTVIEGLNYLDTSNVTNMDGMFRLCQRLANLDVGQFDTSKVISMKGMFYFCDRLTSLDLSQFDTSKVMSMQNMFESCSSLINLDLSAFDTSNVINMHHMFSGCSGLASLDLSQFDTSKVTGMSHMFEDCGSLTTLDVSILDTSSVTDMEFMFSACSALTNLDISQFVTSKVTDMSEMFYDCSRLTSLDVSSFDTSNVIDMNWMFVGCSSLTSLDVSGFDTSNVIHMNSVFSGCSGLTSLDVSKFDTSNVTNMGSMFSGCSGLTQLDLITLDSSQATDMNGMFSGCSGLTQLDLTPLDTSKVTDMSSMFSGCSGLTSLDLTSLDTSNVTDMSSIFEGCTGLTHLDLTSLNTSEVRYMNEMFKGCSHLTTTITIRRINCQYYTDMFSDAATEEGSEIIVKPFTGELISLVEQMVATKSENSNVRMECDFQKYRITIEGNEDITSSVNEAYGKMKISLSSKSGNYIVKRFKMNGTVIEGHEFTMPDENVTITDIEVVEATVIESVHNPYGDDINDTYEKTFEGASSLTIILDYETESDEYDWIYLYDSTEKEYGKYGGSRTTETITIPGNFVKITFTTDSSGSEYYGFKATIVPNYE